MKNWDPFHGIMTILSGALIIYFSNGHGLANTSPDPLGAAFYPRLLGTAVIILGVLLFLISFKTTSTEKNKPHSSAGNMKVALYIGIGIGYILILNYVGFILTTILLVIGSMIVTGERTWWKIGVTSILVSVSLYFLFGNILGVLLP